jgi:hypothetical protein
LRAAMLQKRLLNRVEALFAGESLYSVNAASTHLGDGDQAAVYGGAIDHHRARATLTFTAAFFAPGQSQSFSKNIDEASHRLDINRGALPIELKIYPYVAH